jgi:hypothetical protein
LSILINNSMSKYRIYCSCLNCKDLFSTNVFTSHLKRCEKYGGKYKPKIYDNLNCPHCEKIYTKENAYRQHIPRCDKNPNKITTTISKKGRKAWNEGLTKENDDRLLKISNSIKIAYLEGRIPKKRNPLPKEQKEKMSLTISENKNHNGGYKRVPYISYIKKDGSILKLRGSYEVRLATILDSLEILWEYEKPIKYLDTSNISRHCFPDFYLIQHDKYLDTKGYLTLDAKTKYQLIFDQHSITINLIYIDDLIKFENDKLLFLKTYCV